MFFVENQCYFCPQTDNLIQMSTNSLIIDSMYIDFAQLIRELFQIKIDDDCDNMICILCKDHLSQFYLMKKRAKSHMKSDDVRKSQILDTVAEFLESIVGQDCIVTKLPKLLAIHPDTGNEAVAEELYNCSSLLESQETFGYSLVEMIDDEEVVEEIFEIKVEEVGRQDVQIDDKKPLVQPNISVVKFVQPPKKPQLKTYQNLDPKQKEWVKKELKDSALEIETSYGKKVQRVCNKCGFRSLSSENAFRAHLKTHLNESDEEREQSKKRRFTTNFDPSFIEQKLWIQEQLLTRKEIIETVEGLKNSWSCSECKFVCSTRASFRNHLQKFHTTILMRGPNKHSCYSCHLRFDGENHLKVHNNCHRIFDLIAPHVNYPFCDECKLFYCSNEDYLIHLSRHNENSEKLLDPISAVGIVQRNGEIFAFDDDEENLQEILDENSPTCGQCLKKFSSDNDCKIHLMLFHVNVFICPFDSREFSGIPTLSYGNHLRQFHPDIFPELEIKCSICHMQFVTVYDKLAHMKNCQSKNYQCDHCDRRFFRKPELQHHLRVVTGLTVFACEVCGKRCKDQGDLKIHVRSHTNNRPYPCPHCDKAYKTSSARASHVESHMESTHICEICNVKFRRRILYQRHMKFIHDEQHRAKCFAENTCGICRKSYLRKSHYKNHLKTHQ